MSKPANVAEMDRFNHLADDFNSVLHRMNLEEYVALLEEHLFSSIKDLGY